METVDNVESVPSQKSRLFDKLVQIIDDSLLTAGRGRRERRRVKSRLKELRLPKDGEDFGFYDDLQALIEKHVKNKKGGNRILKHLNLAEDEEFFKKLQKIIDKNAKNFGGIGIGSDY